MTLARILAIANTAYPENLVARASTGEKVGDTLAEFIARELKDTYDQEATDKAQLREAVRAIDMAVRELEAVATALRRKLTLRRVS